MNIVFEEPKLGFIGFGNFVGTNRNDCVRLLESAARNCYKSKKSSTVEEAEKFLAGIAQKGHTSILEHVQLTYAIPKDKFFDIWEFITSFHRHKWFDVFFNGYVYLSGNVRSFYELAQLVAQEQLLVNDALNDVLASFVLDEFDFLFTEDVKLLFSGNYTDYLVKDLDTIPDFLLRLVFYVEADRATTMEWNRHRTLSISQESQRYVKYSKKGFRFLAIPELQNNNYLRYKVKNFAVTCAQLYDELLDHYKAEIARAVLPNFAMTSVYYSGLVPYWQHFIELRNSSNAHPYIRWFADKIEDILTDILRERNVRKFGE